MSKNTFQRILLPGFLFQSVIIGGGYATGRELVEFFLSNGPMAGLLGMVVAALAFSVIAAVSFELARMTRSYDYRTFFKQLLGRAWFLFEIVYFILAILVLAVIGAASGNIVADHLGAGSRAGTVGLMLLIGLLVFRGTSLIERVLAGWSFLLYATYAVFIFVYLARHGTALTAALTAGTLDSAWLSGSLRYVGYSMAVVPMILFCVKHMESRRDALIAGAFAGPLGMAPAVLFFLGMAASYPDIVSAAVPADYMMRRLNLNWLELLFYIVIFGTFVESGTALVHSINERIDRVYVEHDRAMPRWLRPIVALAALLVAIVLANQFGLVDLIARGYGTLTYFIMLVFLLPLLTVGVLRIWRAKQPLNTQEFGRNDNGNQ